MARDRKRAKQRRGRRAGAPPAKPGPAAGTGTHPEPASPPVRADLPGSLDHASSDVDEFDAALVRGAEGVVAPPEPELPGAAEDAIQPTEGLGSGRAGDGGAGRSGGGGAGGAGAGDRALPSGSPLRGGNRAVGFIRASWAELQRVQWPDRRQVTQATAVVLGFVAVAGLYLGLADYVAKEIVEFIL
ncbi:MAG: preprotein translocase subunit SecE [Solirubrobacteraceae bacterium]